MRTKLWCIRLQFLVLAITTVPSDPCEPNPCGSNSLCRTINNAPSCSCLPGNIGSPPYCRPECVTNSDCPSDRACLNRKCGDPCPGSCGSNSNCRVVNHAPNCQCLPDYTGDPFRQCYPKRKNHFTPTTGDSYSIFFVIFRMSNVLIYE